MAHVITAPCIDVKDAACVDECPAHAIYEGPRMFYIHPDECTDCEACTDVCPVDAIYYEDDVPAEWVAFIAINDEFLADAVTGLGSPGGRNPRRTQAVDHPKVAAWGTSQAA
ncbi:ferredoxin family protein [Egibacter rhizosphaerae]|uniref:Ferredoxin n=1 Tax=Egibacter rhizosphaerae TaxID=1670831 RepID=A0A411YG13_9ACTN|nr:ferredoxin [Egibacter rhizosphaerae]QBI20087.1 ferredoxin family protein [Egibacter rhizosphaerae]